MSGNRLLVLVVAVVVFVVAAGLIIYKTTGGGGANRTINLTVTGNSMSPDPIMAKKGDHLTVNVTTDKAEEIHLHGYDIKFAGEPGKTVSHSFTANTACTCVIEIEDTSTEIGSLVVSP